MDLFAPFAGTIYMPDKEFLNAGSPVLLPDGRPIAAIKWHTWSQRFEVLDPQGATLAACVPQGVLRRRYLVRTPDGHPVIELWLGFWRPFQDAELILAGGQRLRLHRLSLWSDRRFEFSTEDGRLVGRITPTTGTFSFRPDSYAFELLQPVMSALEGIALAQALRAAVRGMRAQGAAVAANSGS